MRRLKLWVFAGLAVAGTIGAVLYGIAVAPGASTKLQAAILFFTAAAAVTGYLGVLIGWLGYRLEAGKVPKPDLAVVAEGQLVRQWDVEIELLNPDCDVSGEVQIERDRMEATIAKLNRPADLATPSAFTGLLGTWMTTRVSEEDIVAYRKKFEKFLVEHEEYLNMRHLVETFWARGKRLVLAFTNERAGVPAEGVRAIIHIPTDNDLNLVEGSEFPDAGETPTPPQPPQPRSPLEPLFRTPSFRLPTLDQSLGALRELEPQGNVSPPTIREGSTLEFSVKEVLHNLYEDTRDYPLVVLLNRPGIWTVPYEIHARNLPQARKGKLTVTVRLQEPHEA